MWARTHYHFRVLYVLSTGRSPFVISHINKIQVKYQMKRPAVFYSESFVREAPNNWKLTPALIPYGCKEPKENPGQT